VTTNPSSLPTPHSQLPTAPIGIFDSGIGGLSVLRELRRQLPHEHLLYLADQAHVPYGPRPAAEIRHFSEGITRFLLGEGAKLIVVACNTASAAALTHLRHTFPNVPFVGMEPAVKPAAHQTKSGRVGVLATHGTFASERYADLMARYASSVVVYEDACLGLVDLIESGQINTPETEQLLARALAPMLTAGVDTLVLGCTHYPFVIPLLEKLAENAAIIDPAPAVARQAARLLYQRQQLRTSDTPGEVRFFTTGDPATFASQIEQLLGEKGGVSLVVL
jgi:glutamate racemase